VFTGSVHGCAGIESCTPHGVCGWGALSSDEVRHLDTVAVLELLRAGILQDRMWEVKAAIETLDKVLFVPERNAVQVLGCGDRVIAHFPLPPRLLAAVAE
jgi:hypothetical protein